MTRPILAKLIKQVTCLFILLQQSFHLGVVNMYQEGISPARGPNDPGQILKVKNMIQNSTQNFTTLSTHDRHWLLLGTYTEY